MIRSCKQVRCGHGYLVDDEDGDILKCGPERVRWVEARLESVGELEEAMERDAAYVPRGGSRCSGDGHALSHAAEGVDEEASHVRLTESSAAAQIV